MIYYIIWALFDFEGWPVSQGKILSSRSNLFDSLAVGLSLTCLVHCLALPVLIALLPAWSAWLDVPESFHFFALAVAVPFSLTVLLRARRLRADATPLRIAVGGLVLMTLGLLMPGEGSEAAVTSIGATLLAAAHILNWRRRGHASG